MNSVLKSIQEKKFVINEELNLLTSISENLSVRDIIKTQFLKSKGLPTPQKYSSALRTFALTLHFYTAKAYEYVRRTYNTCLPHVRTIGKWFESMNGDAGFTTEAFRALKLKLESSEEPIFAALMMDEMAIRKHLDWDGKNYHGYVNFGSESGEINESYAKEGLVFLLNCINGNWKIPFAYFFG